MSASTELAVYLEEAHSWDADRAALSRKSERNAWYVAAAGWTCAIAASVALVVLVPLKRVDPFVIRVDNATGVVDVVPTYEGNKAFDETVTRYFLTHYVAVCERFNFETAESDYEECGAFHSAQRNQAWYAQWNRNNPSSPLNVHKDGSSVRVQIESVSFFKRADGLTDIAQVRYLKAERQGAGAAERFTHWIGTLQYAYGPPPKDPGLRRWNPLGFRILEMRAEPEVRALDPNVAGTAKESGQS
jgi:type IV secretion system protein VirB8